MSIVYSKYKNRQVDTDYEEEYEVCDVVYDFTQSDNFRDSLYEQCNFGIEWDDYRKWAVVEDWPDSKDFHNDLLEFAQEEIGRELTEEEKQEFIKEFDYEWSNIQNDSEEWLIERRYDND